MPDLNALIAAYYTANAQAQEYLRKIIEECMTRGIMLEQAQMKQAPETPAP